MEKIAVIGLGYVGLPLALALSKKFPGTIGFDINSDRIQSLQEGIDKTDEVSGETLQSSSLKITADPDDLKSANFFMIAVPIYADRNGQLDMTALIEASKLVASCLQAGAIVVYESTVYPGATEEVFAQILAEFSGLQPSVDFKIGYSPERINPGDRKRKLENIQKIIAAEDEAALDRIAQVYEAIIEAGIYRAPSIKVAEAAKVVENIQRDVNIALMNEFALIFEHLDIRTQDVIAAASTKWNFLPFTPGLVGGNCITNAPHFLAFKAQQVGYTPRLILDSRSINDYIGIHFVRRLIRFLETNTNCPTHELRVGILGLAFKENVSDIRNSRVLDIVDELKSAGIEAIVHDPLVDSHEAKQYFDITLQDSHCLSNLHSLILAVPHDVFLQSKNSLLSSLNKGGVFVDIKSVFHPSEIADEVIYWSF